MKKDRSFYFSLILLLTTGSFALHGQNKLDSIQHLEEVVVLERYVPKDVIPVQRLQGKALQRLNAHSIADALRYFSGVQLKDYGGIGGLKTINVRSMGSQHVGVFFDGIEIGNAQNGVVDLGRYSLDNIEVISLYNGQKSSIFQPAKDFASASSLYMETKTPQFRANKKYNLQGSFKTGSFGLVNPAILWEQDLGAVQSSLNLDYTYSSGKYKFRYKVINTDDGRGGFDTTATRQNGDIAYFRIEHGLYGKSRKGEWKTKLYYYDSERGYPGAVVRKMPGIYTNEDRQWDRNFFAQGSWNTQVSSRYRSSLSAKYAYDYLHYAADPKKDAQVVMKVDNKYMLHEGYLSSAHLFTLTPGWSVNVSADLQWNKLHANLHEFIYPKRYSGWVVAASSLNYGPIKAQASLLATFIHENMKEEKQVRKNWDRYTPTLILSYQPWKQEELYLRGFFKKIFRMPTFNEIYYAVIGSGTSNLKPEYTTQFNLGMSYQKRFDHRFWHFVEGQVDAYYNKVEDKILAKPGGQLFRWTMMNIGLVKIWGVDVALGSTVEPLKDLLLTTRLNYTYQKAQDYSDPSDEVNYKGQISYIPWHSGSATLQAAYRKWNLSYSFIYSGERYSESANEPINKVLAWYTSDMALGRDFRWSGHDYRISLEVNNLFNQQYEVVSRYPMPGTNFKIILKANF